MVPTGECGRLSHCGRTRSGFQARVSMNVLIYSHAFAPSIGGVETYIMLLAQGLLGLGPAAPGRTAAGVNRVVTVTVITQTPAAGFDDALLPFRVIRRPGLRMLWRLLNEADVVHLAGPVLLPL